MFGYSIFLLPGHISLSWWLLLIGKKIFFWLYILQLIKDGTSLSISRLYGFHIKANIASDSDNEKNWYLSSAFYLLLFRMQGWVSIGIDVTQQQSHASLKTTRIRCPLKLVGQKLQTNNLNTHSNVFYVPINYEGLSNTLATLGIFRWNKFNRKI